MLFKPSRNSKMLLIWQVSLWIEHIPKIKCPIFWLRNQIFFIGEKMWPWLISLGVGVTSNQQQEPSDSKKKLLKMKNLEFFQTQNWSKMKSFTSWDRKFVHPLRFWEGKPEEPEVMEHSQGNL